MSNDAKTTMQAFRIIISDLIVLGAFDLEEIEQAARFEFVKGTLEFYGHNQSRAARALRVHRNTLRRIIIDMEHHGIDAGRRQPRSAAARSAERKRTA